MESKLVESEWIAVLSDLAVEISQSAYDRMVTGNERIPLHVAKNLRHSIEMTCKEEFFRWFNSLPKGA